MAVALPARRERASISSGAIWSAFSLTYLSFCYALSSYGTVRLLRSSSLIALEVQVNVDRGVVFFCAIVYGSVDKGTERCFQQT